MRERNHRVLLLRPAPALQSSKFGPAVCAHEQVDSLPACSMAVEAEEGLGFDQVLGLESPAVEPVAEGELLSSPFRMP